MDFLYALFRKAVMLDSAIFYGKKIALSGIYAMIGIVFLNNTVLLLSLSLYNALIAMDMLPYMAAMLSSFFLLLVSLLFFAIAYHILTSRKYRPRALPQPTLMKDTLTSFYAGFVHKK